MSAPSTPTGFFVNVHLETKYSIFVNNILYTSIWLDLLNVYMSIFTKILHNLRTCTCKIGGRGKKKKVILTLPLKKMYLKQFVGVLSEYAITPDIAYLPPLPLFVITIGSVEWVFCCVWPLIYELSCPCVADCTVGSVFAGIIVGILLTLLVLHGKWERIKIFMLVIHISSNFLILILYFGWYKSRCFMITLVHEYLNVWFFFSLKKMRSFKKTRAVSNQSYEADFYIDPVRLLYSKKS